MIFFTFIDTAMSMIIIDKTNPLIEVEEYKVTLASLFDEEMRTLIHFYPKKKDSYWILRNILNVY